MINKLHKCLDELKGTKLEKISFACQMIVLNFDKNCIHCQSLTRISKNNDILFTTYDYQNWNENEDDNDEWYFLNKYKDEIINGIVLEVSYNKVNDISISLDNGVVIELFVSNGYYHYNEEKEQYRVLIDDGKEDSQHIVVYNKHIEIE